MIKSGQKFLMIKISTEQDSSFLEEHQKLIDKYGYAWFCRFGKCNLTLNFINNDHKIVFVRDVKRNGGKKYILHYSEVTQAAPRDGFPDYYNRVLKEKSLWFKITSIKELPDDFDSFFCVANSGNSLERVYNSMCTSFYIQAIKNCNF